MRQGAAQALGKAVKAYKDDQSLITELELVMREAFDNVQNQPTESHRYGDLSSKLMDGIFSKDLLPLQIRIEILNTVIGIPNAPRQLFICKKTPALCMLL